MGVDYSYRYEALHRAIIDKLSEQKKCRMGNCKKFFDPIKDRAKWLYPKEVLECEVNVETDRGLRPRVRERVLNDEVQI